jgi:secreted Zn-dependent insulinase-like peptidase
LKEFFMLRDSHYKSWHLLAAALLALLAACAGQGQPEPTFPLTPQQSANDDRAYRYIELDNGMRALLVSDPDTEKAAAALDVYVGSASNPEDRGGLAHFLEHMLFLGTDKYPDSGEYARYISEHGGSRNAFTAFEHTNYFFDVDADHLPGALDRFAQFFISPRFDAQYVEREVNAVDAEFQMGLNTDGRRNLDVWREVSNPEHPYSILGVGTAETLADQSGDSVRDALLEFYRRYYSANLMRLVVLGSESLDELQSLVATTFAPVPNHEVAIEDITEPLIESERLPMMVYIQPEATARSLMVSFELPDYQDRYRTKPLVYIGNLIGHEGEGSLLSLLKSEGWAEALGAGMGIAYRGGSAFNVSITLTEKGLAERDQVLRKLFEYIQMMKDAGPSKTLYEEQAQLAELAFRFNEEVDPMRYVLTLANDMQTLAPQDVLSGNFLMTDYDPELIREIVDDYLVPSNALITVIAPGVPTDRESEFYRTPYSTARIDLAAVTWDDVTSQSVDTRLHMPAPNAFIADNVDVLPLPADNPDVPRLVVDEPRLRIWQRQDEKFRVPRGAMYAGFLTSHVNDTARAAAASQLYVELLQDAVNEFTYPALLAGLDFSVSASGRGIGLTVSGYNDRQMVLLSRIVDSIVNADFDNGRFDNIRRDLITRLENVKTAPAYNQVTSQARRVIQTGGYDEAALIAELETITPAQVARHGETLWNSSSVEVLLNGNYAPSESAALQKALAPLMRHELPAAVPALKLVKLDAGDRFVYRADVDHGDSVFFWYLQAGDDSMRSRALAGLTGQAISADYFEELRTEQQLGYVVQAFPWPVLDVPAVAMLVQSPGASATDVLAASQAFLAAQAGEDGITEEQFLRHRTALLNEILQPDKNLFEQASYFWREINRDAMDFDTRERLAQAVQAVDYAEWKRWYKRFMLESPASVMVVSPGRWNALPDGTLLKAADQLFDTRPAYTRH